MLKHENGSQMYEYKVKCSEDSRDCYGVVEVELPVAGLTPEEAYAYLTKKGEEPVCAGCGSDT